MNKLDLNTIVNKLSDESFDIYRDFANIYFSYYFIDPKDASKELFLEKFGEFLRLFEMKANVRDDDFARLYTNYLTKYVDNRISSNNRRVNDYYGRLKEIKEKDELSEDDLNDFTRIFLGLYSMCNAKKEIKSINMDIINVNFINVKDNLLKDEPTMKLLENEKALNIVPKKILKGADGVIKTAVDLHKGAQELGDKLGQTLNRIKKQDDSPIEIIHDHIENADENNIHSIDNFVFLLMYLLYLRAVDFEKGHEVA